jgi:hypothetical protein
VDLEVEPSRPYELHDLLQGRCRLSGLDPRDGRLTDAGSACQSALRHAGT